MHEAKHDAKHDAMHEVMGMMSLISEGSGPGGHYTGEESARIRAFCDRLKSEREEALAQVKAALPTYEVVQVTERAPNFWDTYTAHRLIIGDRTWGELFPDGGRWRGRSWAGNSGHNGPWRATREDAVADIVADHLLTRGHGPR